MTTHAPSVGRAGLVFFNSLANILRAVSGSLTTILLPLILVFILPKADYTVWVLVFGMAVYVTYLDLGLLASIQANVAHRSGAGDLRAAKSVAASGLGIIGLVWVASVIAAVVAAFFLPSLFPQIPAELGKEAQIALLLLVGGQLCGLAMNVGSAYWAGLQRSMEPALIATFSRFASLGLAVAVVPFTNNLIVLATAFSIPIVLGLLVMLGRFVVERPETLLAPDQHFDNRPWPLLVYSGPLMLWNVCVLVVNGSGIVIVGLFDYNAVAAYSIASMFAAAVVGVGNALSTPLLAEFSRASRRGFDGVRSLLGRATRVNAVLVFGLAAGALIVAPYFMRFSGVSAGGVPGLVLAALVALSAAFRLVMSPTTMVFIATGTHRRVIFPPLVEAFATLVVSAFAAQLFGALGVGVGVLIGAVIGMALTLTWSMRSARLPFTNTSGFLTSGILIPMLCWAPSWIASIAFFDFGLALWVEGLYAVIAFCVSAALAWIFGLAPEDRATILRVAGPVVKRKRQDGVEIVESIAH